jgi:hypothetical protein
MPNPTRRRRGDVRLSANSPADSAWVPCDRSSFQPMTHRRSPGMGSAHNILPTLARSQSTVRMKNSRSSTRRGASSRTTHRHRRKSQSRPSRAAPAKERQRFAWVSPWQTEQRCSPVYSSRTWAIFAAQGMRTQRSEAGATSRADGSSRRRGRDRESPVDSGEQLVSPVGIEPTTY